MFTVITVASTAIVGSYEETDAEAVSAAEDGDLFNNKNIVEFTDD